MATTPSIAAKPTLYQDDNDLRVTRWDFERGAATGWHEHGSPYLVVMLVPGTLQIDNGTSTTDVALTLGQTYLRPAGIKHDVMNGSDFPIAFLEVEFKRREAVREIL